MIHFLQAVPESTDSTLVAAIETVSEETAQGHMTWDQLINQLIDTAEFLTDFILRLSVRLAHAEMLLIVADDFISDLLIKACKLLPELVHVFLLCHIECQL